MCDRIPLLCRETVVTRCKRKTQFVSLNASVRLLCRS
jgi:hypothetical protein